MKYWLILFLYHHLKIVITIQMLYSLVWISRTCFISPYAYNALHVSCDSLMRVKKNINSFFEIRT